MTYVSATAASSDAPLNSVIYTDDQGVRWLFSGGSIAWRHTNPGNIRPGHYGGDGKIGVAQNFNVYPDYATGRRGIISLLRSPLYRDRTIGPAIQSYAPSGDNNDPVAYAANLHQRTGIDTDRTLGSLNDAEMERLADAIQRYEGWVVGRITRLDGGAATTNKPASLPVDLGSGYAVTAANLQKYWAHTETERGGGYYPIGANSTWHGGVHVRQARGRNVVACAPGEVVAARLYPETDKAIRAFGSVNFILLQHKIKGPELNRIANLHLDDGTAPPATPPAGGEGQTPANGAAPATPAAPAAPSRLAVSEGGLRLRDAAGTSGTNSLGNLRRGDTLVRTADAPVTRDGHTWYHVTVERSGTAGLNRQSGWVASEYVRDAPAARAAAPAQPRAGAAQPAPQKKPFADDREVAYWSLYMHLEPQPLTRDNANLKPVTWLAGGSKLTMKGTMNLRSSPAVQRDNVLGQLAAGDTLVRTSTQTTQTGNQAWMPVRVETAANAALNGQEGFLAVMPTQYTEESVPDADLLQKLAAGGVVKIEKRNVGAGDLLWFSSVYGPEADRKDLLHWEIFSEELLFPEWHKAEDGDDDFNLNAREITALVDQTYFGGDEVLTAEEVAEFYAKSDKAKLLRTYACKFQEEWALDLATAIPKLLGRWETDGLAERWEPHLFWREATAAGVTLPASPKVWHYNPIKVVQALAGGAKLIRRNDKVVPHFSQADAAWGSHTLGNSATITQAGCAMTSVAMVLKYYGRDVDPGTLDAWLDTNSGYSGDALRFDKAITFHEDQSDPKLKYERRDLTAEADYRPIIEQRVQQDLPTILGVHYAGRQGTSTDHFVVVVGLTEDGKFIINDPGTRNGDGASDPSADNVIQTTTRHGGYQIRSLRLIDPK